MRSSAEPRLELDQEAMRAFGYLVIDQIVDHFAGVDDEPAGRQTNRATLEALLREPPPREGRDFEAVLERLKRDVFAHMGHVDHPRFFAFVPSPSNYVSVLGDVLASGYNVFAGTWFESSGPAMLELVTIDWLRAVVGMPETAGGLFLSGGSMANLTALAIARAERLGENTTDAVVYTSDQAHSAVARGLRTIGFAQDQLRVLATADDDRLDPSLLAAAIARDRAAGRRPFCVVASAGTTSTGAVDPLAPIADLCAREDLWFHADGAYGGAAVLTDRGREALAGLDRVDSLALDPHKWLFQPYEIGCLLVRDAGCLRRTFDTHPEYLRDVKGSPEEVNFGDCGIQLTRSFRALKLWLSIQVFGLDAFRAAIDRGLDLAERAEALLRASSAWAVETGASLAVVSFRYAPPDLDPDLAERITSRLPAATQADGYTLVTSTIRSGRTVLRLCTINPRTTDIDIACTIERLTALAQEMRR